MGFLLRNAFKELLVQPQRWKRIGCSLKQKGGITLYSGVGVSPQMLLSSFFHQKRRALQRASATVTSHQSISLRACTHTPHPQQTHTHTHIEWTLTWLKSHGAKFHVCINHNSKGKSHTRSSSYKHTNHQLFTSTYASTHWFVNV